MADMNLLREEIAQDPLSRGYAGMADSQVADSLNAKDRPGRGVVPSSEVRRFVLLNGLWPRLQAVADNATDETQRGAAITILQVMAPNSFDEIRMNDPAVHGAVSAMLQVMVDAGAMTAEHRDAMIALGDRMVGRADELGIGFVHHLDVGTARQTLPEA